MSAKNVSSDRRRSRPVTKPSAAKKLKRNKPALFLAIFIVVMLVFSGFYVIFNSLSDSDNNEVTYDSEYPVAEISTSMGLIAVELYTDRAPKTCENFMNLANDDFYDGLVFHRVIDDFMIQGGGFKPDMTQKNSESISVFEGNIQHEDGTISMASTDARVPGSNQFFICDGAQSGLDGDYAAFGKVILGMDVVRQISQVSTTTKNLPSGQPMSDWPVDDILINSVTIVNT